MKAGSERGISQHGLMVWLISCLALTTLVAGCRQAKEPSEAKPGLRLVDVRLFAAAQAGDPKLIEDAIADGAAVNSRGTNGMTPLLEILREARAPLDASGRACVASLLEHGAQADSKDGDGRTPIIYAARLGDLETVRLLVETGTYIRAPDHFHKTALLYAADGRHRDIVAYLARNGELQSPVHPGKKASSN